MYWWCFQSRIDDDRVYIELFIYFVVFKKWLIRLNYLTAAARTAITFNHAPFY